MRYWDPRIEEMSKADLQAMQFKLLKTLVYRLYSFSDFYHARMKAENVHPDDVRSLGDITKLPFMYKKDLRAAMQRMLDAEEAYVLDIIVPYTEHVLPFIPAGRTVADMIWKP